MATEIEYTQLDAPTRLNIVRQRIRDLETSHQTISMRVNMPGPGEIVSQQDRDNLQMLVTSLNDLHTLESKLESEVAG